MRIAFVTTHDELVVHQDYDRDIHLEAAQRNGYSIEFVPWWDVNAPWEQFDLIVIRSTWDYWERYEEFLQFLDRVSSLSTVWNPPELIRWNLNKRYLLDLEAVGIPIVPTRYVTASDLDLWDQHLNAVRGNVSGQSDVSVHSDESASSFGAVNEIVIKPTISAGSWLTGRFMIDDPAARALAVEIIESGRDVMLQPAIRSVGSWGELAVMWFNGNISHTFRKGPMLELGGDLIDGTYLEKVELHTPSSAASEVVHTAHNGILQLARDRGWLKPQQQLLYQRLDVVELDNGSWALLEAELFEPAFFFPVTANPAATADTFARAVLSLVEPT